LKIASQFSKNPNHRIAWPPAGRAAFVSISAGSAFQQLNDQGFSLFLADWLIS